MEDKKVVHQTQLKGTTLYDLDRALADMWDNVPVHGRSETNIESVDELELVEEKLSNGAVTYSIRFLFGDKVLAVAELAELRRDIHNLKLQHLLDFTSRHACEKENRQLRHDKKELQHELEKRDTRIVKLKGSLDKIATEIYPSKSDRFTYSVDFIIEEIKN